MSSSLPFCMWLTGKNLEWGHFCLESYSCPTRRTVFLPFNLFLRLYQRFGGGAAFQPCKSKCGRRLSPQFWFGLVTPPLPGLFSPQDGNTSKGQTPSQISSLLSSQLGWRAPKLKAPLSLPQLHPAPEAAGAGLACPSSARPGVGGQEQQLGPGTHTALSEAGKSEES